MAKESKAKKRTIGGKIDRAIKEAGMTQKELAEKLNLTQQQISCWVTEKLDPKISALERIAEATGKPINFFLENPKFNNKGDNSFGVSEAGPEEKRRLELLEKDVEILKLKIKLLESAGKTKKS